MLTGPFSNSESKYHSLTPRRPSSVMASSANKYVPRHLVRRRDALSPAVSVLTSTGIDTGVSRSGCLMSMVGPPCDVTDIFAHVVAAMVRRNSPRVVETFGHACVHVVFSIPHCAAPATVLCQSTALDDICIAQIIWNTICGVQPPHYNDVLRG